MSRLRFVVLASGVLAMAGAVSAAPNMKSGLWEITAKMDMPGMPAGAPPQTMQHCITQKDLENPQKMTPSAGPNNNQCEVTNHKVQGNTATWNISCRGEHPMTGSGSFTFNETSYQGTSKMAVKQGNQTMNMTMNYTGRYIGACKK